MAKEKSSKTARFVVTGQTAILHNGQRYTEGEQLELTPEQAQALSVYIQPISKTQVNELPVEPKPPAEDEPPVIPDTSDEVDQKTE